MRLDSKPEVVLRSPARGGIASVGIIGDGDVVGNRIVVSAEEAPAATPEFVMRRSLQESHAA